MKSFKDYSISVKLTFFLIAFTLLSLANYLTIQHFNQSHQILLISLLTSIALTIIGVIVIKQYVEKPIVQLMKSSKQLAEGKLDTQLNYKSQDEVGVTVNNFNTLIKNLESAAAFAQEIGQGKFETSFIASSEEDKLGKALVGMREKLVNVNQEDHKRNWATEGLAKFAEILRSEQYDLKKLSDLVISSLVKYLEANQGALFIINTNDTTNPHLELTGIYAWDKKKFEQKKITPGEGIVGQAWLEKELIYLKQVPESYARITSGLGGATPRSIIVVPLKFNEEIYGVIEIASFKEYEEYERSFLIKLSENIAATISALKVNEQTKSLLKQAQFQTEELRSQEEEMRQNMEELQATQDQLNRREKEQVEEISRLNQLHEQNAAKYKRLSLVADNTDNSVIITDLEGKIEYVNRGFSKLTGYTLLEVIGKKPGSFLQGPGTDPNTVARIREHLKQGTSFYEEILNYDKSGNEYWISLAINPVFENGELKNYISVQANVTETKLKALDFNYQLNAISQSNAIIEFDLQGHIVNANQKFLDVMGYPLDDIKGKHHRMFVLPHEVNSASYKQMWLDLSQGKSFLGQFQRRKQNGEIVWLDGTYTAILDLKGKPYKIIKFAQDITQQKNKAIELEGQINAIDNSMASIEFLLDGTILNANKKFLDAMGYSLDEIKGKHHRLFLNEKSASSDEYNKFWKNLAAGYVQTGEFNRIAKNGDEVWLFASYTPLKDSTGNVFKVIKFAQDITKQKQKTLDFEGQINAINNTMASVEFTLEGIIVQANKKFLDMVGYELHEIKGKHHRMFVDYAFAKSEEYKEFWEDLGQGKSKSGEFHRIGKGNKEIWLSASYTPIKGADGKIKKIVKYSLDITEQKRKMLDFEGQMKAINSTMPCVEFDVDGTVINANAIFLNALNYSLDEVHGKHHSIFVPANYASSVQYQQFWNDLKEGLPQTGEFKRIGKGGKEVWISANYTPIKDFNGSICKIVKFAQLVDSDDQASTLNYEEQFYTINNVANQ